MEWAGIGAENLAREDLYLEAKEKYKLKGTFLDYEGLLSSLPREYITSKEIIETPFIADQISHLFKDKSGARNIYNRLIVSRHVVKHWESKWTSCYGEIDWPEIYKAVSTATQYPYYRPLHYKIITFLTATNKLLYRMGVTETNLCDRCRVHPETLRHKFWACELVINFWRLIENWMNLQADAQSRVKLNEKCVVLGRNDCGQLWSHVIIVGKYVIQRKKDLRFECFIARMYEDFKTERMTASMDNRYLY